MIAKGLADVFKIVLKSGSRALAAVDIEPGTVPHHDLARDRIVGFNRRVLVDPVVAERDDHLLRIAQIGRDVPLMRNEPVGAGKQLSLMVFHIIRVKIALRRIPRVHRPFAVDIKIGERLHRFRQLCGETVVPVVGIAPESGQANAADETNLLIAIRLDDNPVLRSTDLDGFCKTVITAAQPDGDWLSRTGFADLRNGRERLFQCFHGIDRDGCNGMFFLHDNLQFVNTVRFFYSIHKPSGNCKRIILKKHTSAEIFLFCCCFLYSPSLVFAAGIWYTMEVFSTFFPGGVSFS